MKDLSLEILISFGKDEQAEFQYIEERCVKNRLRLHVLIE